MNRVVITGMGVISPAGNKLDTFFQRILSGETCVDKITAFDTEGFKATLAAEVKDFDPHEYLDKKEVKRTDRFCHFAIAAADEAVKDSKIDLEKIDLERVGVIFASGIGGIMTLEEEHSKLIKFGPSKISPLFIPKMIGNMACGKISMRFGFKGTCYCPVSACASSAHAIGEAFHEIASGRSDIIVAGGAEAAITPLSVAGFTNMTALSTSDDKDAASLPFDKRRNGFVMGEGAGALILESYESAKKRNAKIYAEICGYGSTADAYHITSPDPEGKGASKAMSIAIKEAGIEPKDIDYINAHGTGTPLNDAFETLAIKNTFGEKAYDVAVSSTKGVTGHLLGAAGAVEAIVAALSIKNSIIPPTANLIQPDEELDLDYVPLKAREMKVKYVLSNSLGFGGSNASILFKKAED